MQACSSGAIEFGDLNNKESKVFKAMTDNRNYHLLEELHTLPSVGYLTKVRNTDKKADTKKQDTHHG
jgi:molybdopterin-containing oxidoreductase family iron-sulfur binding subunit